jgi:hypothetical protein
MLLIFCYICCYNNLLTGSPYPRSTSVSIQAPVAGLGLELGKLKAKSYLLIPHLQSMQASAVTNVVGITPW